MVKENNTAIFLRDVAHIWVLQHVGMFCAMVNPALLVLLFLLVQITTLSILLLHTVLYITYKYTLSLYTCMKQYSTETNQVNIAPFSHK